MTVLTPSYRNGLLIGLCALLLLFLLEISADLSSRLRWWLGNAGRNAAAGLQLREYQWDGNGTVLGDIPGNLSGLAFDSDNNRLLAVINNPAEVITLDLRGTVTGRYPLQGFADTEGIAYLGGNLVAVVEERSHSIYFLDLPAVPRPLHKQEQRMLQLAIHENHGTNKGFEGLAYDRLNDRLFVAKERSPRRLYQVNGVRQTIEGHLALAIIDRSDWLQRAGVLADLSSLEVDPETQHLLLLSDQSRRVVELDGDGIALGELHLDLDERRARRPEGIALDQSGTLYLASEPNVLHRLTRRERSN